MAAPMVLFKMTSVGLCRLRCTSGVLSSTPQRVFRLESLNKSKIIRHLSLSHQRCLASQNPTPTPSPPPKTPEVGVPYPQKPSKRQQTDPETRLESLDVKESILEPPATAWRYLLDKLINFVSTSADNLEKRVPKVFLAYRTLRSGLTSFVSDTKDYYRVSRSLWDGQSMTDFSRRELELYRQFSSDLPLVGLMLVIAFAPGGAFIFPLAYVFPRFMLSHHFWTPEQTEDFRRIRITKQVKHYDTIMDYLTLLSRHIDCDEEEKHMKETLRKLDLTVHLTEQEILSLKPLFEGRPYKIDSLSIRHVRHLSKSLRLSVRRKRLVKDGLMLHYMDMAMKREGLSSLNDADLDQACEWRGLNPIGMKRQEKIAYLNHWVQISSQIHESSISLLLHLPVLLSFCHRSNRQLMGPKSGKKKRGQIL